MQTRRVQVAIIGAGTAGIAARREAEKLGASVVLIEGGAYGTTCARVGCMPSKLLIAAAEAAHQVAAAGRFGVVVPPGVRVDGRAVLERVRRERDRFVGFVLESIEALPEAQRPTGAARFVGPTALEIGGHTRIEAGAVVIASGSRPFVPPPLAALQDQFLTTDDVFELPDLPASVAVIGTGAAGLEIGQALHRLGVRTTIFSRGDRLGPLTDPEVLRTAVRVLGGELDLHLNTPLHAVDPGSPPPAAPAGGTVERAADGFHVRWQSADGAAREARFDAILCATGRRANLDQLDLAAAGVRGAPRIDPRTLQCGDLPIFIAGDANGDRPLLHEAADEGAIAGANAARFPEVRAALRRVPLNIVFCAPNLAIAGASWAELRGEDVAAGSACYDDQGRARVIGENAGLVRVYARRACATLVGAELFGPRVEHLAHLLAWAVQSRLTVEQALAMPFYHPVIEEGLRTALRDLSTQLRLHPAERPRDLECGPGA